MRSPVKPKKFLGQHFLKDMDIARRIAETMIGYAGVPILEIGPGTGVLTRFLLAAGHDLTVVEIDRESVAYLRAHFPELDNRILEEDFLKLRLDKTLQHIEPNIFQSTRLQRPHTLLQRHDTKRGRRAHGFGTGQ